MPIFLPKCLGGARPPSTCPPADKKLGNACTVHETIRVKSAAWDDAGERCAALCRAALQRRDRGPLSCLLAVAPAAVSAPGARAASEPALHQHIHTRMPAPANLHLPTLPACPPPAGQACWCTPRSTTSSTACPTATTASSAPWTPRSTSPRYCMVPPPVHAWLRGHLCNTCIHPFTVSTSPRARSAARHACMLCPTCTAAYCQLWHGKAQHSKPPRQPRFHGLLLDDVMEGALASLPRLSEAEGFLS